MPAPKKRQFPNIFTKGNVNDTIELAGRAEDAKIAELDDILKKKPLGAYAVSRGRLVSHLNQESDGDDAYAVSGDELARRRQPTSKRTIRK